jgi:ABC-2 type transport system permease protein
MTGTSTQTISHASAHKLFSFRRVFAIAGNTFRDLVRQKVFYFMIVFAIVLIGGSLALVNVSFHGQLQTVMDVSLGAMSVFTMMLAVLSTAMLLPKDMEERTLYTILAKPVARFEYMLGKLLGVALMLTVATLLMSVFFFIVLYFWQGKEITNIIAYEPTERVDAMIAKVKESTFSPTLYGAMAVLWLRALVCSALTLMISAFATSWLFTVIISFMMVLIGHLIPIARSAYQDPVLTQELPVYLSLFLRSVALFFPDMQLFNIVDDIAVGVHVPVEVFANTAMLGAGYLFMYLMVGYLFFAWREL